MKRLGVLTLTAFVIAGLFVGGAVARQQTKDTPTGLALKIVFDDGPPSYNPIPGPDSKGAGVWFARFRRIPSWRPPAGSEKISAVKFGYVMEGDAVRVNVSALTGRFHEKEEAVATYLAREDEKITIRELAGFGVVPFEVTVVRIGSMLRTPPPVVSKAKSLEVIDVQTNTSTLPSYKLLLRNLASKNVASFELNVVVRGKKNLSTWPGAKWPREKADRTLIAVGATYEMNMEGADDVLATAGVYTVDPSTVQSLVISTVVFEDGTYEGDADYAAIFTARKRARQMQFSKELALLKSALAAPDPDTAAAIESFKAQLSSLEIDANPSWVDRLLKEFPPLGQMTQSWLEGTIRHELYSVKQELLNDFSRFEKEPRRSPATQTFTTWLNETRKEYEKQMSRL